jgi:hypothetical protein
MSDVLCAFYRMGPVVAGVVEGSPTEEAWLDSILSALPSMASLNRWASVDICYRAWIYLHSTLLRLAPFTREEQVRLGIASSLPAGSIDDDRDLLEPHLAVHGQEFLKQHLRINESLVHCVPMQITLNHFLRLGPIRRRDRIESVINPLSLSSAIMQLVAANREESPVMRSWALRTYSKIKYLLRMHEEVNNSMTMSSSVVTLDCSPNIF